jgi:hypothetical protein
VVGDAFLSNDLCFDDSMLMYCTIAFSLHIIWRWVDKITARMLGSRLGVGMYHVLGRGTLKIPSIIKHSMSFSHSRSCFVAMGY